MKAQLVLASLVAVGSTAFSYAQNQALASDPSVGRLPELVVLSNPSIGRLPEFVVRGRPSVTEGAVGVLPEFAVYAKRSPDSRSDSLRSLNDQPETSKARRTSVQNSPSTHADPSPAATEAANSSPNRRDSTGSKET